MNSILEYKSLVGRYTGKIPVSLHLKYLQDISEISSTSNIRLHHAAYIFFNGRESSYDDLTVKKQERICKRCGRAGWDVSWSQVARDWLCKRCNDVWVRERC